LLIVHIFKLEIASSESQSLQNRQDGYTYQILSFPKGTGEG